MEVDAATARAVGEPSGEDEEAEKIEVHVHVHRGKKKARRKRPAPRRTVLTGELFDWKGHYDRVCKPGPQAPVGRWARLTRCASCDTVVGLRARTCTRCGAPRSLKVVTRVLAALGLGAVAVVFVICARLLGGPLAEDRSLQPIGVWSEEDEPSDVEFIEVQVPYSPFAAPPAEAKTSGSSGQTR